MDPSFDPLLETSPDPSEDPLPDSKSDPPPDPIMDPPFDPLEDPLPDAKSDPSPDPIMDPPFDPSDDPLPDPTPEPLPDAGTMEDVDGIAVVEGSVIFGSSFVHFPALKPFLLVILACLPLGCLEKQTHVRFLCW